MKIYLLLFLFLNFTIGFAQETKTESKRDSIIDYAQSLLETPYLWGGTTPKGFDCSGFLYYVFQHNKIKVSRTSSSYTNIGTEIKIKDVKPADVLLFTGTDLSKRKVGHVGIVISNTDGIIYFIHSSSSKKHYGVTLTKYNNSGYTKRFLKAITLI